MRGLELALTVPQGGRLSGGGEAIGEIQRGTSLQKVRMVVQLKSPSAVKGLLCNPNLGDGGAQIAIRAISRWTTWDRNIAVAVARREANRILVGGGK